jgi:hypothetical protein
MLYDTKYCWRHIIKPIPSIVAVVQHVCQVTVSTSLRTHQPFVYDTTYCWRHITKRFELIHLINNLLRPARTGYVTPGTARIKSIRSTLHEN